MRNILLFIVVNIMICNGVLASNIDDLREKFSDGDIYLEYVMTKQNSKGDIEKNQTMNPGNPFERFDKFIYVQKDDKKYFQRNEYAEPLRFLPPGEGTDLLLDNYVETLIANTQIRPLFESVFYYNSFSKVQTHDINIIYGNQIYAIDRFNNCCYYTTTTDIAKNPRLAQLLPIELIVPTLLNSILFNDSNKSVIKLENSEVTHDMSQDLLCETYSFQKTNEYGSPIGEIWYFKLLFKDGKLLYFSDALSSNYLKKIKGKHISFFNKVIVLNKVEDESIFTAYKAYNVKKFEDTRNGSL